jgi:kinesin family protein C1
MQGEGVGSMRGITPRAVEQILKAGNLMKHTWNFYVQANFVEIYNEKLVDLLSDIKEEIEFFNSCEDEILTLNPGINKGSDKLILRKDVLGQTFVEGLTNVMIDINDYDRGMAMINSILKCAARARTVASTKMNDRSSRSHSVFTLDIAGRNLQSGAVTAGSLHLVDLAGSERLDSMENQVDAQQLKETTNINKSLSCLGDVFSALASDAGHVPYRNSKLTYLLQNCLGGDGKACMVVNLSPDIASSNESLQSLRFAQRVSQIELGRGTKKVHLAK